MKRENKIFISFLIFILLIEYGVYYFLNQQIQDADVNLKAREIETSAKLFLNGYFGALFGFKYSGNINWLIVPIFVLYIIKERFILSRGAWMLFVFLLLCLLLIGVKGFFNPRYQYTIVPTIICLMLILLWDMREYIGITRFKILLVVLISLSCFNIFKELFGERVKEKIKMLFGNHLNRASHVVQTTVPSDSSSCNNILMTNNLLSYIESMAVESFFLVNNLPDFYYYTNKKGYYYWCGNDEYYSEEGIKPLFNQDMEKVYYQLKKMNCKYIYTYKLYFGYNKNFDLFIRKCCILIAEDRDNRVLYKILDNFKE